MEKKYGEKYAALRAAAEARQRQRGATHPGVASSTTPSSTTPSSSLVGHGSTNGSTDLSDGDARYRRLQELQAQQRERKARASMTAGEVGGASAPAGEDAHFDPSAASSASGGARISSGPPQHQQQSQPVASASASLPPRPRQPPAPPSAAGAAMGTSDDGPAMNSSSQSARAQKMNMTAASTPATVKTQNKLYATPGSASLQQANGVHADGGVSFAAGSSRYYETPVRGAANSTANANGAHDSTANGTANDHGEAMKSPPPPKTPLTTMRHVMDSIHKDRSAIDGARRGALFGDETGGTGHNNGGGEDAKHDETHREWDHANDFGSHRQSYGEDEAAADAEETIEDDPYHQRRIDARCLPYGAQITLRFRDPAVLASLSVQPQAVRTGRGCFVANEAHGLMGGIDHRGENRFTVARDMTAPDASAEDEEELDEDGHDASNFVCYGDKITLRSGVLRRVVGVQKEKAASTTTTTADPKDGNDNEERPRDRLAVGCFRRDGRFPPGNRWTVLRGGPHAPKVRLGPGDDGAAPLEGQGRRIPVYSGDPIALRNEWTGGLLSLGGECPPPMPVDGSLPASVDDGAVPSGWALEILTSSYQSHEGGGARTEGGRPLIEYLHEHAHYRPGRAETFQMVAADVPPCPGWAYPTGEGGDRMYLGGTYLARPARHARLDAAVEAEVFPEVAARRDDDDEEEKEWPTLAAMPVDVQERILLDEVLGAMMGQEGRYLTYRLPEDDDDSQEEEEEEEAYPREPAFGFAPTSVLGGPIDPSLDALVARILPLCTNHAYVHEYVAACLARYEGGMVARALAEAMAELLEEYLAFVSELDRRVHDEGLSMSIVHVRARPSIRIMAVLAQAVAAVRGRKGGDLLNALNDLMAVHYAGDAMGRELLRHLLMRAAAPYAGMLRSWLEHGKVHDPYGEFMIEVTDRTFRGDERSTSAAAAGRGVEWTQWCRERGEHVPFGVSGSDGEWLHPGAEAPGLDRSRATSHMSALHKAHATGKFWRAIHVCRDGVHGAADGAVPSSSSPLTRSPQKKKAKGAASSRDEAEAQVLLNPLRLSRRIDRAYHEASDTMLRILLDEHGLLSSLRFMKRYFLLDQGDFFVDFLDGAEGELHKELPDVLRGRVQNWLGTSLARTSDGTAPGLAAALRCTFQNKSLRDTLDDLGRRKPSSKKAARQKVLAGFEAIAFEFKGVPFPTSIVLSQPQLRIYQLLFRLIFFAKYVERRLVGMWSDHQLLKAMQELRAACGPTFSLRRRMLHFIQNFVYYLKFDVIEPGWRELEGKLSATKEYCTAGAGDGSAERNDSVNFTPTGQFPRTVDDLLHQHNEFLIRISGQCLLTNYDLIDRASKIMTTCLLFSTQIQRFMETTKVHDLHERTRHERSKLRYGTNRKARKDGGDPEADFRADREERTRRCSDGIERELSTETYRHMITRFDEVFSAHLAEFMRNLENSDGEKTNNAHLQNLAMQLDFNGFLSSSMHGTKRE